MTPKQDLKKICKNCKWQLTRINQDYQMTRVEGLEIACRKLNLFEKIRYYFQPKKPLTNKAK